MYIIYIKNCIFPCFTKIYSNDYHLYYLGNSNHYYNITVFKTITGVTVKI